jgi:hypothetical protein
MAMRFLAFSVAVILPLFLAWMMLGPRPLLATVTWAIAGAGSILAGLLFLGEGGLVAAFGVLFMLIGAVLIYFSLRLRSRSYLDKKAT